MSRLDEEEEWRAENEKLRRQQQQQQQAGVPPRSISPTHNQQSSGPSSHGATPPSAAIYGAATSGATAPPPPADPNGAPPRRKKLLNGASIEYRYPSGSVYHGAFKDGKLHGYGKYTYHPSGDVYEGEWVSDMKHGHGVYTYEGGDRYVGEWRSGKKHGKGTYTFTTGDEYIGGWKDDRIHGHGVFTIARNGNRYEGQWEESYRHGFGVLKSGNGNVYEGTWVRGKEEGLGVLQYPDGNVYAGDWKQGQMDGKGILVEKGQKHTVENISSYTISKVPVADDAEVDPEFVRANRLYLQHVEKQRRAAAGGAGGPGGAGGDGGDYTAIAAELEKTRLERDMFERKYRDMLTQNGAPQPDVSEEDVNAVSDIPSLRSLILRARAQRTTEKQRADDAEGREKVRVAEIQELQFKIERLMKDATAAGAGAGAVAAGSAAAGAEAGAGGEGEGDADAAAAAAGAAANAELTAEVERLRRKAAELERELHNRRTANGGVGDATELKVKYELLETEVQGLRSAKDDLAKARLQSQELQLRIAQLNQQLDAANTENTTLKHREAHQSAQNDTDVARRVETQTAEIRDLRQQLTDAGKERAAAEEKFRKGLERLHAAETKALQFNDVVSQLETLKMGRGKDAQAAERRAEELDRLRDQNAELTRQLEEMQLTAGGVGGGTGMNSTFRGSSGGGAAAGAGAAPKPPLPTGASAAATAALEAQVQEFQMKLEATEKDAKKDKKKLKKAVNERDELRIRASQAQTELGVMERQYRCLVEGHVLVLAKLRREVPTVGGEKDKKDKADKEEGAAAAHDAPVTTISLDGTDTTALLTPSGGAAHPIKFDGVLTADASPAQLANDCRRVSEGVADGFNGAIMFFGPMGAGKSHALREVAPLVLQHALNACAARSATHDVQVGVQAIELSCDGVTDLLGGPMGGAGGVTIRKDSFGAVVFDGATTTPLANLLAFRDLAALMANAATKRHRQRSHIVYVVRATMTHRLNGSALAGKLVLVDLAGSGALGDQDDVTSAKYVNRSVVALQNVIRALTTQGQTAVPYLEDPLTTALSDVLGGNSRTVLVAAVDPTSVEESQQALALAAAAREIRNVPKLQGETAEVVKLRQVAGVHDATLLRPALHDVVAQRD